MLDIISKKIIQFPTQLILLLVGGMLFISFIGNVPLIDPYETKFAAYAKEMSQTLNWEKITIQNQEVESALPFFTWMQTISKLKFGNNEFSYRFPTAIIGIFSLLLVFRIGKRYYDSLFGLIWALLLGCSPLTLLYFKAGVSEPMGNFFIFLSAYQLFKVSVKDEFSPYKMQRKQMFWGIFNSSIFSSIALLTTGSINILIILLLISVITLWNRGRITFSFINLFWWILFQSIFIFIWLSINQQEISIANLTSYTKHQFSFLFQENSAGIRSLPLFIALLAVGMFPSTFLLWRSLPRFGNETIHQVLLKRWMFTLIFITFILLYFHHKQFFHQITLAFYPITFLGALTLHKLYHQYFRWNFVYSIFYAIFTTIWAAVIFLFSITMSSKNYDLLHYFFKHDFIMFLAKQKVYWSFDGAIVAIVYSLLASFTIYFFHKNNQKIALFTLIVSNMLFFNFTILIFTPKVERYLQGTYINALKIADNKVSPVNFKSYAPFVYQKEIIDSNTTTSVIKNCFEYEIR